MKELILVRHGESLYNALLTRELNSVLTPKGEIQAKATGEYLAAEFPDISEYVAITSPYFRTLQTSKFISEKTGLKFRLNTGPRESMLHYDYCAVDKIPEFIQEICPDHDGFFGWEFRMESLDELHTRLQEFYSSLPDKALVVSHGTPVTVLHELACGLTPSNSGLYVNNCGVTYVRDGQSQYHGKIVYQ